MSSRTARITSPTDPSLAELCSQLRELSRQLNETEAWPADQLRRCGECGVFAWFVGTEWGGQQWSEVDILRGYLALSAACLTTTFVITQRIGACQRIERSDNLWVKQQFLPPLVRGEIFATVGISHLTTSRRHLKGPVLRAEAQADQFVLNGYCPWVTGAAAAEIVVIGATLDDGRQILVALPTNLAGIEITAPVKLEGLTASHTGALHCHQVRVGERWLLAGPVGEVMKQGLGARTGGLQTSTLAVGLADCAIGFLELELKQRPELADPTAALRDEWQELRETLLRAAVHEPVCSDAELRTRANSLVLRSTQAALVAAKGAGYVRGHPAGRWCREALFFLVWSCPQPVLAANLCEFAGLDS